MYYNTIFFIISTVFIAGIVQIVPANAHAQVQNSAPGCPPQQGDILSCTGPNDTTSCCQGMVYLWISVVSIFILIYHCKGKNASKMSFLPRFLIKLMAVLISSLVRQPRRSRIRVRILLAVPQDPRHSSMSILLQSFNLYPLAHKTNCLSLQN